MRQYTGRDADSQPERSGKEVRAGKPEGGDGEAARSILVSSNSSTHISVGSEEQTVENVVFAECLPQVRRGNFIVALYETDGVVGNPGSKGVIRNERGVRGPIDGQNVSRSSLREVCFRLGNSTPRIQSMLTVTFHPVVEALLSAPEIMKVLNRFLVDVLGRSYGWKRYIWVREHQAKGTVHFHIFIPDQVVGVDKIRDRKHPVNRQLSQELSARWVRLLVNGLCKPCVEPGIDRPSPCFVCQVGDYAQCEQDGSCIYGEYLRKMATPWEASFIGCVQIEPMQHQEAAARYAAKEGSKRFQKSASGKWSGRRWWFISQGFECEPVGFVEIPGENLAWCSCSKDDGFIIDAPFRVQHGLGAKLKRKSHESS